MPWKWSIVKQNDDDEIIVVCGDAQRGEMGWIVCEIPYMDHPDLQDEARERAEAIKWTNEMRDALRAATIALGAGVASESVLKRLREVCDTFGIQINADR
jgi:vacuolar-type H+-ATPase catalytic subunit A/Vma1